MGAELQKGANLALPSAPEYRLEVTWAPTHPGGAELDVSAFLLAADGRTGSDAQFVFYNNPRSPCGAVRLDDAGSGARRVLRMRPSQVPPDVARIALCITCDGGVSLAAVERIEVRVTDDADAMLALFRPETAGLTEAALILGEVYRHPSQPGQWKFRAVAQGFAGGLGPLARHFGVDVGADPTDAARPASAAPAGRAPVSSPANRPAPKPSPDAPARATRSPTQPAAARTVSRAADLAYSILYRGAYAMARIELPRGRQLKAQADAMVAMTPTLEVEGRMQGGLLGGLGRLVSGESLFLQTLTATRGDGDLYIAPGAPGDIAALELDGAEGLLIARGGFLACSDGVEVNTQVQNLAQGLFSGAGLFVIRASGVGLVFVEAFGTVHRLELGPGQQRIIDNGHLVAWSAQMRYDLELGSRGLVSAFTSGENLVCRFHGPGTVLIQSRQPNQFGRWIAGLLPGG